MDRLTKERRSWLMSRVRSKHTKTEMVVRRLLYGRGYRYRLHRKDLPGKPDLVFGPKKKVVFVHGCYWHGHGCKIGRLPKSNVEFWAEKIRKNRERDTMARAALENNGWQVLTVWQCETKDVVALEDRLIRFLESDQYDCANS